MRREERGKRILRRIVTPVVAGLLRVLAWSWRVEWRGRNPIDDTRGALAAVWHRNILTGAGIFRDTGIHVGVSHSRDGDHIVAVVLKLGLGTVPRGSSARGGVGLARVTAELLEQERVVVVISDGSRGPARRAKAGVARLAQTSDHPVFPVAIAARPAVRFNSWDRMQLPLPFARVICWFGDPITVREGTTEYSDEQLRERIERTLNEMTGALDAELGLTEALPAATAEDRPSTRPASAAPAPDRRE